MTSMLPRRALFVALSALGVWLALTVCSVEFGARAASAKTPEDAALQIENRLLCPQCTNLRLDVCDTTICADMRTEIKDRLAKGESDEQIIAYFQGRYGQRVLAEVPAKGFNLVLFGWVGVAIALVVVIGTFVLVRLRRTATPELAAGVLRDADEQWLDEQLHERDAR